MQITQEIGWQEFSTTTFIATSSIIASMTTIEAITWSTSTNINSYTSLKLDHISLDDKKLRLVTPIEATIDFCDNMWRMENKELGIVSMALAYDDCLQDFNEEIAFIYEEYGLANDSELTKDAIELKHRILRYLKGKF